MEQQAPANIFGTDGVRDRGGAGLLSPESLERLGSAIASYALRTRKSAPPTVLIGRDTRPSGPAIEASLSASLTRDGCRVVSAGVLPTPAISLLVAAGEGDLGIVISASHNPPQFNGVKLFDPEGRKLDVEEEERITRDYVAATPRPGRGAAAGVVGVDDGVQLGNLYLSRLLEAFGGNGFLGGMGVVVDCARGATAVVGPEAFRRAGARVTPLFADLDGERINAGCGSLHPEELRNRVTESGAALGIAFDGDGDRCILVDERGGLVDGDEMLALWALALQKEGRLRGSLLVATVMSNAGMESFLTGRGVRLLRTPVGDREVFEAMEREDAVLGGEQSGHVIYRPEAATGDGIRTGLHLALLR
ncbi:MAG: phosphoglucosamine mutase, partial [Planctomycetota bacterium]